MKSNSVHKDSIGKGQTIRCDYAPERDRAANKMAGTEHTKAALGGSFGGGMHDLSHSLPGNSSSGEPKGKSRKSSY